MDFLITGKRLVNKSKKTFTLEEVFKNKSVVIFFFGAIWCTSHDCTVVISNLKQVYKESGKRNSGIEIIFVSSDTTEPNFDDYFKKLGNWYAIPFQDSAHAEQLRNFFGVTNLPYVVVCKTSGDIITKHGRQEILQKGVNVLVAWTE